MNPAAPTRLPLVLLVDDDESFRWLFGYAFRKSGIQAVLESLGDCEDAIKYLSGQEPFSDRNRFPRPAVVLLDLNMPGVSGWDVLHWKNTRADLGSTHFCVISCSDLLLDRKETSKYGICAYHLKPMGMEALIELIKSLERFFPPVPQCDFHAAMVAPAERGSFELVR